MALINYSNVNVYQESMLVLKDVNFTVEEGEFIYLTGKVGSGKSSLLKTLYAEIPVKEGKADVLGFDLTRIKQNNVPELRRKLGIIFQDFQLLTDRSVEANLRFVLKATGWKNKHDMEQRIKDVLELVGMSTKGYKMPNELSGGEQQRISIARAILNKPKLILADEPTGNLDVETSNSITELLQSICKAGSMVIMITHNMNLLSRYPGKVFRCEDHQISEIKTPTTFDLSALSDMNDEDFDSEEQAIKALQERSAAATAVSVEDNAEAKPAEEVPHPVFVAPRPVESVQPEAPAEPLVTETTAQETVSVAQNILNTVADNPDASLSDDDETAQDSNDNLAKHNLKPIDLDKLCPSDMDGISNIENIIKQHNEDQVID
ncbi:MAG: ATP-binding cassette domain-containing protein [Bacteroidaceae bacterium]|nr:ATP-binding cassette domain-containing protein [Bacteroidaceae bacterium]